MHYIDGSLEEDSYLVILETMNGCQPVRVMPSGPVAWLQTCKRNQWSAYNCSNSVKQEVLQEATLAVRLCGSLDGGGMSFSEPSMNWRLIRPRPACRDEVGKQRFTAVGRGILACRCFLTASRLHMRGDSWRCQHIKRMRRGGPVGSTTGRQSRQEGETVLHSRLDESGRCRLVCSCNNSSVFELL